MYTTPDPTFLNFLKFLNLQFIGVIILITLKKLVNGNIDHHAKIFKNLKVIRASKNAELICYFRNRGITLVGCAS